MTSRSGFPNADDSWEALAGELRPFLLRRLPPADADDVLQEVLVRIDRGRAAITDTSRFGPWVYRVARHAMIDHRRLTARSQRRDAAAANAGPVVDDDAEATVRSVLASYASSRIEELPSPYRQALALVDVDGMSQTDAAVMLGISVSGMKSRVQRAREKLRALVEASCTIDVDVRGRAVDCAPRSRPSGSTCSCDYAEPDGKSASIREV